MVRSYLAPFMSMSRSTLSVILFCESTEKNVGRYKSSSEEDGDDEAAIVSHTDVRHQYHHHPFRNAIKNVCFIGKSMA